VEEGVVFNKCNAEGNFGSYSDYFVDFYFNVYVLEQELTSGTCKDDDNGPNVGAVVGIVIGAIASIVAVAALVVYYRRQGSQMNHLTPIGVEDDDLLEGDTRNHIQEPPTKVESTEKVGAVEENEEQVTTSDDESEESSDEYEC